MHGQLVTVTTRDLLRLHGLYCPAKPDRKSSLPPTRGSADSVILIHGLAGNFYSSRLLLHFAASFNDQGLDVLLVNSRGHEMINTSSWSGKAQYVGAAMEDVDHCRHDIAAWVNFLMDRGSTGTVLFGHSLGAIKSLYSQAIEPNKNVRAIVALSATRLSYEKLLNSPQGNTFRETLDRCEERIDAGQGDQPILVPVPFPTWMTPKSYLSKYGPEEKFNWLRFIDRVDIPTLLLFGGRELSENPAFVGLEKDLGALKSDWNSLTVCTINDADHFYTSKFGEAEDSITRWLTT